MPTLKILFPGSEKYYDDLVVIIVTGVKIETLFSLLSLSNMFTADKSNLGNLENDEKASPCLVFNEPTYALKIISLI